MRFDRSNLDKGGTLKNVIAHYDNVESDSQMAVLMYEMMVANACGVKSISPALLEKWGVEKQRKELKDFGACLRGEGLTKSAVNKFIKLNAIEGATGINITNYISLATYYSGIYGPAYRKSTLAFPDTNVNGVSFFNYTAHEN